MLLDVAAGRSTLRERRGSSEADRCAKSVAELDDLPPPPRRKIYEKSNISRDLWEPLGSLPGPPEAPESL